MAQTYNEALLDAIVRHQIGLLRFSGGLRNRVWRLLDASEADMRREITRRGARAGLDTPAGLRSTSALLRVLRETRLRSWRDVRAAWFEELRELVRAEPGFLDALVTTAVPVELGTVLPSAERLRRIVTGHAFQGRTLRGWADNVQRADLDRIEQAIKIGLTQGEAPRALSRRIVGTVGLRGRDGVTQITRRNAAAITRTAVSGLTAQARAAWAEANKDVAPQEVFTATLDSRTTPICRRFDGELFDVGEGPVLPLHFGERSIYSPVIDGQVVGQRPARNFTERSLLREFAAERGFRAPTKRAKLPHGTRGDFDAFARVRMRELTGQVPARTTYQEFLGRQTAAIQDDILGPNRGRLFRRGGLTLDKFVEESGRELTLAELADRHRGAFLTAGLDPDAFN